MKNIYFITIWAGMMSAGCQPKAPTAPAKVDLNAVNDTITKLADKYLKAWNAEDMEELSALIADDGEFYGSDPAELMDKTSLLEMYTQFFSDTTTDYSYDIDIRKIRPAADGKSAIVVEYITLDDWSPVIPLRQTSHLVKTGNDWKIDFIAWGLIAKNEDVEKLNKALE